ncbi:MAG: hypothetical protein PQ975_11295 [Methanobacterium sp.]
MELETILRGVLEVMRPFTVFQQHVHNNVDKEDSEDKNWRLDLHSNF